MEAYPNLVFSVRANRAFLARAVRFLAPEMGIRQFLDIGTGIPTADNTHEVAQRVAPDSRIVYVDNDPIVLLARQGAADQRPAGRVRLPRRRPAQTRTTILAAAADTLDFSQPVAVMLLAVLQFVGDDGRSQRDRQHG